MKIKYHFLLCNAVVFLPFCAKKLTSLVGSCKKKCSNPGECSGHGKSILIWPSKVGRDKRQLLMPSQIFHVATIALMISSQTSGKHTDRPQQNGREVTSLVWPVDADIIS